MESAGGCCHCSCDEHCLMSCVGAGVADRVSRLVPSFSRRIFGYVVSIEEFVVLTVCAH